MSNLVDLHVHTCRSDGSLTPAGVVRLAAETGLAAVAITDHDTTGGVEEALEAGRQLGIEVIPGVELSTGVDNLDVHLVALFPDIHNQALQRQLAEMLECRITRNLRSVSQLREAGFSISSEDLAGYGEDKILTRGNIAEILVRKGYAENVGQGMRQYLSRGGVGYVRREVPEPSVCIELIHKAGGLIFVAHMNQIDRSDPQHSIAICRQLIEAGADGLEARYCEFDDFWRREADQIAAEYGCLRSGGSDFHGDLKQGLRLGTGYGDLRVPAEYLEAMKGRLH